MNEQRFFSFISKTNFHQRMYLAAKVWRLRWLTNEPHLSLPLDATYKVPADTD